MPKLDSAELLEIAIKKEPQIVTQRGVEAAVLVAGRRGAVTYIVPLAPA